MNKRHLYWLAASLAGVGLGLFIYKALALDFPLTPRSEAQFWELEMRVSFIADGKPVKVSLFVPRTARPFAIVNENYVSRDYGLITTREDSNRQAVWSQRRVAGEQVLYYRAVIHRTGAREPRATVTPPEVSTPALEGPHLIAAQALLARARDQSADVDTLVAQLIKRLNSPHIDSSAALLVGENTGAIGKVEAAIQVLALADIPARLVRGVRLQDQRRDVPLVPWLQVHDGKRWQAFDPATGQLGLPNDYLVLWHGAGRLVDLKGGDRLRTIISVRRSAQAGVPVAFLLGQLELPRFFKFSLFALPIETQEVYRVLLTIPVGALLLVILRNVIGIKTFGTFMPVLIALAFRETQLVWGVILFTLVVALGLSVRFYLEQLKLLLVPRLACVLIVVVLSMALISLTSHVLGLERGLSVALFPMVILTMTIERMSIVWEEQGATEAIQQGLGSLAAAVIAYLVMSISHVAHLVFVFPELLLVLLAVTLLLGRYSGYRLTELRRFRALSQEPS